MEFDNKIDQKYIQSDSKYMSRTDLFTAWQRMHAVIVDLYTHLQLESGNSFFYMRTRVLTHSNNNG